MNWDVYGTALYAQKIGRWAENATPITPDIASLSEVSKVRKEKKALDSCSLYALDLIGIRFKQSFLTKEKHMIMGVLKHSIISLECKNV